AQTLREKAAATARLYKLQEIKSNEDSIIKSKEREPAFAAYKDNYFITGIPLNKKVSRSTADTKFQISIRQRLTNSVLPFNTFLYLTYTQKSFWDIYKESSPFHDANYNPGIGLGKQVVRNGQFLGTVFMQAEHESNGQGDSILSRSWNYLSWAGKFFFNTLSSVQLKFWIPLVDGGANQDLLDYRGLLDLSFNTLSPNRLWWFTVNLNPRKGIGNFNVDLGVGYRLSRRNNQYLYTQFFSGYGEGLLDYNRYSCMLRIGICIKPDFFSSY
ncbi:MAG: phospholipase A, partial [Dysgonamonadaceae bacterium]|nr:phospholipase A [Dysgonamonadaceae bacterium]